MSRSWRRALRSLNSTFDIPHSTLEGVFVANVPAFLLSILRLLSYRVPSALHVRVKSALEQIYSFLLQCLIDTVISDSYWSASPIEEQSSAPHTRRPAERPDVVCRGCRLSGLFEI
jgi:hypothetical protein